MDVIEFTPVYLILLSSILIPLVIFICYIIYRFTVKRNKNSYIYIGITLILLSLLVTLNWVPSNIYLANQCMSLPKPILYKDPLIWADTVKYINYHNTSLKVNSQENIPSLNGYEIIGHGKFYTRTVNVRYSKKEAFNTTRTKQIIYDKKTGNILFSREYLIYSPVITTTGQNVFGFKAKGCSNDDYYYDGDIYFRLIQKFES